MINLNSLPHLQSLQFRTHDGYAVCDSLESLCSPSELSRLQYLTIHLIGWPFHESDYTDVLGSCVVMPVGTRMRGILEGQKFRQLKSFDIRVGKTFRHWVLSVVAERFDSWHKPGVLKVQAEEETEHVGARAA